MRALWLALASSLFVAACAHTSVGAGSVGPQCSSRQIVLAFYNQALIEQHPRPAFERYASRSFVEHKPDVPQGTREATITFLEELIASTPRPRWEILRTIAEGDMVFVHARFSPAEGAAYYAIADVFRLQDCLIVEHWDVVSGPPASSENPNDRF
ncbi:nuclear transport factor 2 family protein [Candidatus Viadribacter manganicus]|uniref:nuclear transport factor 2 family protein n=1 Tax=Candidatus Viadribacter manganicus TaxID=1759059 RepID=UPI0009F66E09|nr:nuclear transport factor 2 family protein [Candidatus Viadribacter manganicus]